MQENTENSSINLSFIISKSTLSNLVTIAEFLDHQTAEILLSVFPQLVHETNFKKFLEIIFVKIFSAKYLHSTDRSNYMTIYEDQKFMEIENNRMRSLWLNSYRKFKKIEHFINDLKIGLVNELSTLFDADFAIQNLFVSLNDPMPPELNLRKSDIGTYCNSSFQFYLVGKRFPSKNKSIDEPFSDLHETLNQMRDSYFGQQNWAQKIKEENGKQKIVYFSQFWYKINSENYQRSLILSQNNYVSIVHNTIVYLVALFDVIFQILDEYMENFLQDFLHEFIEFNMRFAMLRNSLLELQVIFGQIQRQLDFLFQLYNQIVQKMQSCETQNSEIKQSVKMSVWRCLLSKWYLYMKRRHDSMNMIYCFLFKKMNYAQFCSNLKEKEIELSQYMISLQNGLGSSEEDIQGNMIFEVESPLIDFIEDSEFVQQLLKEYVEYMVDISINEDSVHWCGHSKHEMHIPYQEYSQFVVDSLHQYLQKIFKICNQVDPSDKLFVEIIRKILDQMDKEYLKPITLQKLISEIFSTWGHLLVEKLPIQNNKICGDYDSNEKIKLMQFINFAERDQRIEHFNYLQKIPSKFDYSCNIVIQTQDFNSSLKRSAQTNDTDSGDQSNFDNLQVFDKMSKSNSINYDF